MARPAKTAIGIDLGTTNTVVARLNSSGVPETVVNADGDKTTPSAVYFDQSTIVVGKKAIKAGLQDPARLAQAVKREMGKPVYSRPSTASFTRQKSFSRLSWKVCGAMPRQRSANSRK